jgi:formylglycine-generating enzyme required for sulfatase activity
MLTRDKQMVEIPAGSFRMGCDLFYPEEAPVRDIAMEGFLIDQAPVTVADFPGSSTTQATSRLPSVRSIRPCTPMPTPESCATRQHGTLGSLHNIMRVS